MFRSLTTSTLRRGIVPVQRGLLNTSNKRGLNGVFAHAFSGIRSFSDGAEDAMKIGEVKWFDAKKGFGFLVPEDESGDVFVHHTAIHGEGFRSLMDGEPVEFQVYMDDNGRKSAQNVTGPDGAYVQGRPQRTYNDYGDGGGGGGGGYGGGGRGDY